MIHRKSFLQVALAFIFLSFMFACGPKKQTQNKPENNDSTKIDIQLSIDTFATFPDDISGCSCYFSNDSTEFRNGKYIFLNDYAEISYMKINGKLTKFSKTQNIESDKFLKVLKAKNDLYEVTVEIKEEKKNGYETRLNKGTIRITDKKGHSISKCFYGECGC